MKSLILYAILLIWISITIGVGYKLLYFHARKSTLIMAPFLPLIAFIFNIKFSYNYFKKKNCRKIRTSMIRVIYNSLHDISIYTGILCVIIAENNLCLQSILYSFLNKDSVLSIIKSKLKKEYNRYEQHAISA